MLHIKRKHFAKIASTQDYAKQQAATLKAGEWLVVTADQQTKGRGTHHRTWVSPLGGLYATFSLLTEKENRRFFLNVSQIATFSVVQTISAFNTTSKPQIKWVNDVLLNDKKVAGVLCESAQQKSSSNLVLHIGVGVNINTSRSALIGVTPQATSLAIEQSNQVVEKEAFLKQLQSNLYANITQLFSQGFLPFHPLIDSLIAFKGKRIYFDKEDGSSNSVIKARLTGIDQQGALILNGEVVRPFITGRVLGLVRISTRGDLLC